MTPNCAGVPDNWEPAAPVKNISPVSAAFFLGMGGYTFSMPFASIADRVKETGVGVGVYQYTDYAAAQQWLETCARAGAKIALCGFSAGVTAATYLQTLMPCDLLISVAASTYDGSNNHLRNRANTKRARLFYGDDAWSSAGRHDDYDTYTHVTAAWGIYLVSHLLIPAQSIVINGVLDEFARLRGTQP